MHLDVRHFYNVLDAWDLPDPAAIAEDVRVFTYHSCVALEVHSINLVVADQCHEQTYVTQSEVVTCKVLAIR